LITLLSDTAYPSFIGEVEALNTTTIRRLIPSARHQLPAIALAEKAYTPSGKRFRRDRAASTRYMQLACILGEASLYSGENSLCIWNRP
jgi:hypothetical protein